MVKSDYIDWYLEHICLPTGFFFHWEPEELVIILHKDDMYSVLSVICQSECWRHLSNGSLVSRFNLSRNLRHFLQSHSEFLFWPVQMVFKAFWSSFVICLDLTLLYLQWLLWGNLPIWWLTWSVQIYQLHAASHVADLLFYHIPSIHLIHIRWLRRLLTTCTELTVMIH